MEIVENILSFLYCIGVLFHIGYFSVMSEHKEDTWVNAFIYLVLCLAFPLYWGMIFAFKQREKGKRI